jgi:hypothetical protein
MGDSPADEGGIELERAVLAYFTARTYEIHRIQRPAIETNHFDMSMITLDIFNIIN